MSLSTDPNVKKRYVLTTALVLFLIHAVFAITLFMIGIRLNLIEMKQASILFSICAIAYAFSAMIIRSGRISLGGWLMIITLAVGIPLISLFIVGFGWARLFAIPLLITWIASQALANERFTRAIFLGVISGIAAFLIDLLNPAKRASLPLAEFIFPAIVVTLIFITTIIIFRRFQNFTLQTKVLILFLVVAILPLSILAILNNQLTRNTFYEAANKSLFLIGTQTTRQIDAFIQNTMQSLRVEAQNIELREYLTNVSDGDIGLSTDAAAALALFERKDTTHILSYALMDREGGVHVTYPATQVQEGIDTVDVVLPFMGVNFGVETGMRTSLVSGQPFVSPVLFDDNNQASISFVTPVFDILNDTSPVGLLLVEYNALILQELMENQNELAGVDSFGVLFDENQLHIAHGIDPSTLYKTVARLPVEDFERLIEDGRLPNVSYEEHSTDLPDLSEKLKNTITDPFFTAVDVATGDRINQVAVARIVSKPWQAGFFQPQDVYLTIADQQTRNTIILSLMIAVIVAIASVGATRILVAPINVLTQLVEHIAAGNLALQAPIISRDEIGRLAVAFNAMTSQVRSLLSGLEHQVAERTKALERQAIQLQTAAEVARDASNIQDIDELLERTVNLIHDRFGFYHAGIFLLNERAEYAVLRAANSEGGNEMVRRGHRLKVGETGIVGYATSRGEPRIALDVDADVAHFAHPLLPETRSEMALPLIVGGKIIGALDVQSVEANDFDESDITVLQVLADQLAIAIENTRLLSEVRQTVKDLQAAYGEITQESWQKWTRQTGQTTGFRYRGAGIEPTIDKSPEAILALKQGKQITKVKNQPAEYQNTTTEQSFLAVPIRLRDQTLGVISLQFDGNGVSEDMISLIDSISIRLASALEGARLYEETQMQAENERRISEITSRMRETLDIESVLQTAATEFRNVLNLAEVEIRLGHDDGKSGKQTQS